MIEVGDLVRLKNNALHIHGLQPFGRTRWKKKHRRFRGKQIVARVTKVLVDSWDWENKQHNRIVELDVPGTFDPGRNIQVSTSWLSVIHKERKPAP